MTDLPAQTDLPFEMRQVKAIRTDEASVYDYEITNLADQPRHYWFVVKYDLGNGTDFTTEGTIEPGETVVEQIECPHDDTGTARLEFTHSGERVQASAGLIAPLPTVGFHA